MIPQINIEKVIILKSDYGTQIYDLEGNQICSSSLCPNGDLSSCQINRDARELNEFAFANLPGYVSNINETIEKNILNYLKGIRG